MKHRDGFTLVELLVAMSILMMVTLVGSFAYGQYAEYWRKEVGHFEQTASEVQSVSAMFSILKHIKPYVLKDEKGQPFHYFEGGKSVIRSVAERGLAEREFPVVFELKVEESEGFQTLYYREVSIGKQLIRTENDIPSFDYERILLEGFDDLTFEFFGWSGFDAWIKFKQSEGQESRRWYGFYSGKDTLVTPELLRFNVSDEHGNSSLLIEVAHFSEVQLRQYMTSVE